MHLPVAAVGSPEARQASVEVLMHSPTAPTILAFAGIAQAFTMPRAEFVSALAPFDVNALFVRDLTNSSYQQGLTGLAPTAQAASEALRRLVGPESTLLGTVGVSVGGLAAIMYGHLLEAPRVLAFGPRIRLSPEGTAARRRTDPGYPEPVYRTATSDMSVLLADGTRSSIEIHVASGNRHDLGQVNLLRHLEQVTVIEHATDRHGVAGWLKEQGRLVDVLENSFGLQRRT